MSIQISKKLFSSQNNVSKDYTQSLQINKINPVALQPYRALADRAAAAGQRN